MPFVKRLQDRSQEHLGHRVGIRYRAVDNFHAAPGALLLFEDHRDHAAPGDPRGIERQHVGPVSRRLAQSAEHRLEGWPIVVLARFDRVGVFANDDVPTRGRELVQRPALGVDRHIRSILTTPQV